MKKISIQLLVINSLVFCLSNGRDTNVGNKKHLFFSFFQDCKCTFEGQKSFYAIDNLPICGDCAGIGEEPQE